MNAPSFDVVTLLVRKWRWLAICAALGLGGGLVYGYVAPKWYEASLTVVPSQRASSPAAGLLANIPGAESLGVAGSTDVQRIQAVLTSASVADEVIAKFALQERYGTDHIELARRALAEHCLTKVDRKSGVVTLTCEDQEPEKAMAIAAFFGDVGNRVFGRISATSAREERLFLGNQVVKARKDVDESSRKLREFQEQHRLIDLAEQSKAVISAMASVKGQLVSKQLELSYLTSFSSRTEANVVQLQQQIGIMEAKLKQLEDSRLTLAPDLSAGSGSAAKSNVVDAKFFPEAMRVPELRYELEQLLRDQKIQETVFFLMTQRYETARADEARDTSTFQILDHPTLPTFKARPKRTRIAVTGFVVGIALGGALLVLPAWWRRWTMTV